MVNLVIRILLAISTHTACEMGTSTDYYKWVDAHPDYSVPMTLETDTDGDYWLMEADDEYYLFKFATDISDTLDSGTSAVHGECFRKVE